MPLAPVNHIEMVTFTQDNQVKVLPFLSSDVRNNAGVPAAVAHRGVRQTQTAATCRSRGRIVSVYLHPGIFSQGMSASAQSFSVEGKQSGNARAIT